MKTSRFEVWDYEGLIKKSVTIISSSEYMLISDGLKQFNQQPQPQAQSQLKKGLVEELGNTAMFIGNYHQHDNQSCYVPGCFPSFLDALIYLEFLNLCFDSELHNILTFDFNIKFKTVQTYYVNLPLIYSCFCAPMFKSHIISISFHGEVKPTPNGQHGARFWHFSFTRLWPPHPIASRGGSGISPSEADRGRRRKVCLWLWRTYSRWIQHI